MSDTATETEVVVTEHGSCDPCAPRVVLVHGAMDRAKSFEPVIRRLRDLRVVAYDRRGYGASVKAGPPTSLTQHVDDLFDVLGDEPTTVVAHSFGCIVAAAAAISEPHRFLGLGLWEPQVPWMEFWPAVVREGLVAMAAEDDTNALAERVYASMVGNAAWRDLPEAVKADRRAEGAAFQCDVAAGLTAPFSWEDLRVPTVFGVGLRTWPFAQDAATRLAASLGAKLFTAAEATHSGHVSHPDQFAQFVRLTCSIR